MSTKIHQLVDGRGRPLVVALTPGQAGDSPMLKPLLSHLVVNRLGPGRPRPAAVVAMSGFLPRVADWPLEPERLRGVPVGIAHGSLDPVIPAQFAAEAEATLTAAGADVLRLSSPVPHMVDPDWIEPLRDLVARATAA